MLWLILAAGGLAAPDITKILSPEDYPAEALAHQWSAAAILDILVDPKGKVARCNIGPSIGAKQLAGKMCDIIRHKRVSPAHDASGIPSYGVAHQLIKMWQPDTDDGRAIEALKDPPDVELSVNKLPDAAKAETKILLLVDATGRPADCSHESGDAAGAIACSAREQLGVVKVTDPNGNPVSYVTEVTVRVTTGASSSSP
jgi:Gram-negative bacterial TonB protein C-terminal